MNMKMIKEIGKWTLAVLLGTVMSFAFFALVGENDDMKLIVFLLMKLGAIGILYLGFRVGKSMAIAGLLPGKLIPEQLKKVGDE